MHTVTCANLNGGNEHDKNPTRFNPFAIVLFHQLTVGGSTLVSHSIDHFFVFIFCGTIMKLQYT
jgi:hypothetical protein